MCDSQSRLPSWLCIGVPKAGTTSLYDALARHPDIWIPKSKETHFFSSHDYSKGINWYRESFFTGSHASPAPGELTPKYLAHRDVPQRIREHLGTGVKFIVLLRHPVERAWSHYCHSYDRFRDVPYRPTEDLTFEDALEAEPERLAAKDEYSNDHGMWLAYFHTGLYATHLKRWFQFFDRDLFMVITLEDLVERSNETLQALTEHLGIPSFREFPGFPCSNSYSRRGPDRKTRDMLFRRYREHTAELEELLHRRLDAWYR